LADRFGRATVGGRQTTNDVKNPHSQRLQAVTV
jgi:hypothetical protein